MLARILALLWKEIATLLKDRQMRGVLLVPPLLQVFIFAYAANYDVTGVRLAVRNEDRGAVSTELLRRFADSPSSRVVAAPTGPVEAAKAIDDKIVAAVVHVGSNVSADVLAGRDAHVQLLLDARRSNSALLVDGYAGTIVAAFAAEAAAGGAPPLRLETRDWFNPTLESQYFVLPGLFAILSFVMTTMVAALSLARERELGTMEQLLATLLRPIEILIGKAVPALLVGLVEANIVVLAALLWFRLPMVGNPLMLEAALCVFMLSAAGIGLVLSSFAETQQQAILGVFVYTAPAIVLSGYASPVENMPPLFEILSRNDPLRYMVVLARGIVLYQAP